VHFFTDAQVDMASAYGGTGRLVVILVGFGCVAFLVWRSVVHQRERLNPDVQTLGEDPAARKYLHEHRSRTEEVTGVILGVLVVGTLGLVFVSLLFDVDLWTALGNPDDTAEVGELTDEHERIVSALAGGAPGYEAIRCKWHRRGCAGRAGGDR
jgi:hypothetical protein